MNLNYAPNCMASGLVFMFIFYLIGRCHGVQGGMSFSRQEELELEKQLKLLKKPAIKTIKTDFGEIFDCVDFNKQPAFDHPLLRNHSYHFQMKPRFPAKKENNSSVEESTHFKLKVGHCPVGTVPIRRTTKEELIREMFALNETYRDLGQYYKFVAQSRDGERYSGALGFLSTYQPTPVKEQQYSSARIHLQNEHESIQFGWRVDPTLYGDDRSHFYIRTYAPTAKCFDAKCGFLVTNQELTPGKIIPYISTIGGDIFETKPRVQRDLDGKWWLSIERDNKVLGFWPKEIFTQLTEEATFVEWGGEVNSLSSLLAPPMGSGIKPGKKGDGKANAYFRWMAGINRNGEDFNPDVYLYSEDPKNKFYGIIEDPSKNKVSIQK